MLEYLQLTFIHQDRECTGIETCRETTIGTVDGNIICSHSSYASNSSTQSIEDVYTDNTEEFLNKVENTNFKKWNYSSSEEIAAEGDFINLKYKENGKTICMGDIGNTQDAEQLELLLLSLFDLIECARIKQEIDSVIKSVSRTLGKTIPVNSFEIMNKGTDHVPSKLSKNEFGVYAFYFKENPFEKGIFLKIGKAGSKSAARWTNQHYSPSSCKSNLSKSLLEDKSFSSRYGLKSSNIGKWIKDNTYRFEIKMDSSLGPFALELVESILHYKYQPKYEG